MKPSIIKFMQKSSASYEDFKKLTTANMVLRSVEKDSITFKISTSYN